MQKAFRDIAFLQIFPQDQALKQAVAQTDIMLLWKYIQPRLSEQKDIKPIITTLPPVKVIALAKKLEHLPIIYGDVELLFLESMKQCNAKAAEYYELQRYLRSSFSRVAGFSHFDEVQLHKYIRNHRFIDNKPEVLGILKQAQKLHFSSAGLFAVFLAIDLSSVRKMIIANLDLPELKRAYKYAKDPWQQSQRLIKDILFIAHTRFGVSQSELAKWG